MKFYTLLALVAVINGHKLNQKLSNNLFKKAKHACDYVDDKGDEIETSLAVQLESKMSLGDEPDTQRV